MIKEYGLLQFQKQLVIQGTMVNLSQNRFYQIAEEHFPFIHKTTLFAAALLYLSSSLVAVTAKTDHQMITLARLILYNSVIFLLLAETVSVLKNRQLQTKFTIFVFFIQAIGYSNLAFAAIVEKTFNRGVLFMVASFLISIAKEMGIVLLLVPKNQLNQKRYHFLSNLNSCCSALMFFFGALVSDFWSDEAQGHLISSTFNILSGMLLGMSVYYSVKAQDYKGYMNMPLGSGE